MPAEPTKVALVAADGARAEVYAHGAHVTSWTPAGGDERLFLSSRSVFDAGSATRGGVPVIFPQFASEGPLPKHGFARTMAWDLVNASPNGATTAEARFRLVSSPATQAIWPHAFLAELSVVVHGQTLELTLSAVNAGATPFTFTAALHTYLRVADVAATLVRGLRGHTYRDATAAGALRQEEGDVVAIVGEVNRIYFDVASPLRVEEPSRVTTVSMDGFTDVVVWNPGPTAAAIADMEPDGERRMLCVEAAVIGKPVTLQRGERWVGRQRLSAR